MKYWAKCGCFTYFSAFCRRWQKFSEYYHWIIFSLENFCCPIRSLRHDVVSGLISQFDCELSNDYASIKILLIFTCMRSVFLLYEIKNIRILTPQMSSSGCDFCPLATFNLALGMIPPAIYHTIWKHYYRCGATKNAITYFIECVNEQWIHQSLC